MKHLLTVLFVTGVLLSRIAGVAVAEDVASLKKEYSEIRKKIAKLVREKKIQPTDEIREIGEKIKDLQIKRRLWYEEKSAKLDALYSKDPEWKKL